jgi:hypothetical protein
MSKLISVPSSPWFISSSFTLNRAVGVTASPFTGKQRTQEYDMVLWTGEVTLPPMNRAQAANWQSFLLECVGSVNTFNFIDPDAKTPTGTYSANHLAAEVRVNSGANVESATLSFTAASSTLQSTTDIFDGCIAGDFITVSGANNVENNGTHKITTVTSDSIVILESSLVEEASTTGCKVRQNVKGSEALSLQASGSAVTGTIKKGDYLAIYSGSGATSARVQLVMATDDATVAVNGGNDHYSVPIQPKLRAPITDDTLIGFANSYNTSQFRLQENNINWSANEVSLYGITFGFTEVI